MTKRVVITGIGWVTPLGTNISTVWSSLLAGKTAMSPTKRFDATTFPTKFSAQVAQDYDYRMFVKKPQLHEHVSLNTAFALGAASQAWRSAGLDESEIDHERLGMYLGSGEGSLDFDNFVNTNLAGWDHTKNTMNAPNWAKAAGEHMSSCCEMEQEPNMPLTHLALEFDVQGPAYNCLTACAASTQAIGEASEILRRGDADIMIVGGAHTMIHPFGVTGFNRLTALSRRNDSPETASRPFSGSRDGFVMGEGAGMLIIETLEHAQKRNAKPLAELIGYGSSADAYRITDIQPEGKGAGVAMRQAMAQAKELAGVELKDVNYISAHGTGTKENDSIETKAVKNVFGDHAKNVPMSSVKSMLGHLIAAAGAVELITCVLAIRDGKLPPTMNLDVPDPDCDLDYVPNASRDAVVNVAMSNSFGFGGQNDTLVLKRFEA